MIADLKPYSAYRESGLPWLGDVPEHWDVKRLKLLLREVDCRSSTGKEQLLRVSRNQYHACMEWQYGCFPL